MPRARATFASVLAGVCAAVAAAPAGAAPAPLTQLHLSGCQFGLAGLDRQATYYARMRATSMSDRMAMRFVLSEQVPGSGLVQVSAPALEAWHRSRSGVRAFGFTQAINGLQAGASYTVSVDYRWYDGQGRLVHSAERSSAPCREENALPGLRIAGLSAMPGAEAGSSLYSLELQNTGSSVARGSAVAIFVDGVAGETGTIDALAAGEQRRVTLRGPVCQHRIRAVVERAASPRQATVLAAPCPAPH